MKIVNDFSLQTPTPPTPPPLRLRDLDNGEVFEFVDGWFNSGEICIRRDCIAFVQISNGLPGSLKNRYYRQNEEVRRVEGRFTRTAP